MDEQQNFKVGLTVIAGLLLLAALIFLVSDTHLLQSGYTFYVTFNFANGLSTGAPVMADAPITSWNPATVSVPPRTCTCTEAPCFAAVRNTSSTSHWVAAGV